jgi:predicted porin
MKRKVLPLVISSIAAFSATQAMAEASFYGKANISLHHSETEFNADELAIPSEASLTELHSNASRIGVKGSENISDSLKAIYKFEYETFVDDGIKSSTFSQRNIYVGLQGDFGTVAGGMHDTPFKLSQGKVDQFNDLQLGDIKNVLSGETRAPNVVWYATPKMGNLSGVVALVPNEDTNGHTALSAMANYKQDNLYVAVALDQKVRDADSDAVRLVGQYTTGDFGVGGIYQIADMDGGDTEESGLILSGFYNIDKIKLKAQYGMSELENGGEKFETTQLLFGADYKLSKNAKVYAYYAMLENEADQMRLDGSSFTNATLDQNTLGVGLEVKF